jgi:hypothetical protein
MTVIDIYRGKIAYRTRGKWYWAQLAGGVSAIARSDAPNEHHAICQNGRFGHILPKPLAYLTVGEELERSEVEQLATHKFGYVETLDLSADE